VFADVGTGTALSAIAPTTADAIDGVAPKRITPIRNVTEAVEVVHHAHALGEALVIRGGGTFLEIGNPPRDLATLVSTTSMKQVLSYSPQDMVVTVEAGLPLGELDRLLATSGQRIVLEAPNPETTTIGGVAAANYNGGLAYRFGYPRDQILGLTVVDGRGRVLRTGGRVVKNVAGYDLPRLFVGSFGTLAIVVDVTLRTHPRPEATDTIFIECLDARFIEAIRRRLFLAHLPLLAFDVIGEVDSGPVKWRMHLSIEGTPKQVAYMRASIESIAREEACSLGTPSASERPLGRADYVARFSVTPNRAVHEASMLLSRVRTITNHADVRIECGGTLFRLKCACSSESEITSLVRVCREHAAASGGALLLERIPHEHKRDLDVWCGPVHGLALMRQLKAKFDPNGILSPGRFVGGL